MCLPWAGCRCPLNKKKMIDLFVCLLTVGGVTILCNMYLKIISAASAQCSISKVHRITSSNPLPFVFSASRTASPCLGNCYNITQYYSPATLLSYRSNNNIKYTVRSIICDHPVTQSFGHLII